MAPEIRISELKSLKPNGKKARKAGVMALFYPDAKGVTHLLLILRKKYKGVHSNQIAFPGGKAELEDDSILQTALRETHEEVGVPPDSVQTIKSLSMVYIPPSNFEVYPFIGLYEKPLSFVIQDSEVESVKS